MSKIVEHECAALGARRAAAVRRARPRDRRPGRCARSTRSARSRRSSSTAACRTYVSVDGGMSDNIRTALYDADYSCALASRSATRRPMLRARRRQALRGRRRRGQGRVPARRRRARRPARRPATGAYCRSMATNYNHVPRPPVVAVRDGEARVVVRRETEDDLLASTSASQPAATRRWRAVREDRTPGVRDDRRRTIVGADDRDQRSRAHGRAAAEGRAAGLRRRRRRGGAAARRRRPTTSAARSARRSSSSGSPCAGPRPARDRGRPRRCSPPTPTALVARDDVDVVVEVIGGIEPARTLMLTRAGARRERRHRQQGAARRGRRRRCTTAADEAGVDLYYEAASPARSRCCGRCASRSPATGSPGCSASSTAPPTTSSTRWTDRRRLRRGARARPGARLRRGRPDRRRRGVRRRGQGRDPGRPGLPHPGRPPPTSTARASPRSPPPTSRRRAAMGSVVKLLAIAERVAGHDGRGRSACACTRR